MNADPSHAPPNPEVAIELKTQEYAPVRDASGSAVKDDAAHMSNLVDCRGPTNKMFCMMVRSPLERSSFSRQMFTESNLCVPSLKIDQDF